jgi:hypothetical protein
MGSGYEPKGRAHANIHAGIQWDKNDEVEENSWKISLVILQGLLHNPSCKTSWSLQVRNNISIGLEIMARGGPEQKGSSPWAEASGSLSPTGSHGRYRELPSSHTS